MGALEDTFNEFKHAKPPEKALIIAAIVGIVGIALYWRIRTMSSSTSQGTVGTAVSTTPAAASPYPTIPSGQVPVLPSGTSPVYGPSGDLTAYQQGSPTATAPAPTPSAPLTPTLFAAQTRGLQQGQTNGLLPVPIWTDPNADWNSVATSIPLNQQIQVGPSVTGNYFGKAATYYPVTYKGQSGYIGSWDLAATPTHPALPQGGGPFGTAVLSGRRSRIAPSREGHSYVAKQYARRPA
jgi:hypothetical protein